MSSISSTNIYFDAISERKLLFRCNIKDIPLHKNDCIYIVYSKWNMFQRQTYIVLYNVENVSKIGGGKS